MIETWLVGLLATLIATPVAIASWLSARHAAAAGESQPPLASDPRATPPARRDEGRGRHRLAA